MNADERWVRIFGTVAGAAGYFVLSAVAFSFLRYKHIGHRVLLWATGIYFASRGLASLLHAYYLWRSGGPAVISWTYFACAALGLVFAGIVFAARGDLLVTLRTTELEDLHRKNKQDDLRQADLQLAYLSNTTKQRGTELVRLQREGAITR